MNNQQNFNQQTQRKSHKITLYTGKSMLVMEHNLEDEYVMFSLLPSIGQQKYDFQNRIVAKMSGSEIGAIIDGLETYRIFGPSGFTNLCNIMSNGKYQNAINFYHDSQKQQVSISLFLTNNNTLNLFFTKNDKNTQQQTKIGFSILPMNRMFLELVLKSFIDLIVKKVHIYNPQQNNQNQFNNPQNQGFNNPNPQNQFNNPQNQGFNNPNPQNQGFNNPQNQFNNPNPQNQFNNQF